jgi:hypothetical protein
MLPVLPMRCWNSVKSRKISGQTRWQDYQLANKKAKITKDAN